MGRKTKDRSSDQENASYSYPEKKGGRRAVTVVQLEKGCPTRESGKKQNGGSKSFGQEESFEIS